MGTQNTLAASVQPKKGRLYAVIQVKENGKAKAVWRSLGLPEGTGKSKVNKAFREVVKKFENEYAEGLARNGRPFSDIPVFEYMCAYLKKVEPNLQKSTFQSYHMMVYGKIRRYFEPKPQLTVGSITAKDIEKFYEHLFAQKLKYHCYLKLLDSLPVFCGFGTSIRVARMAACKLAYEYLEKNDMLFTICDEIENPNRDDAINQLEILARRGYFSIPTYEFSEEHDDNGNPVWTCECHIEEYYFDDTSSSKKDAKKGAAYSMLMYVLGLEKG